MDSTTVPLAPRCAPLLGHALPLIRDPLGFVTTLSESGPLVRLRMGSRTVVLVCAPELIRDVLLDDRVFDKGGPLYDRGRESLGDGLLLCPHQQHRRQRRLCQPSFRPDRFSGYAHVIAACAQATALRWRDGQIIDVNSEMMALAAQIAVGTMLTDTLSEQDTRQMVDDLATLIGGLFRQMLTPKLLRRLPLPAHLRYRRAHTRIRQVAGEMVATRRADRADNGDLLSALSEAIDTDTGVLSEAELVDQVITFYAAGVDTTASVLAWALDLLAHDQRADERLHAESVAVLDGQLPVLAHVPTLRFTGQVVTETLRLYPPGWLLTRTVTHDTTLGGARLPAGTEVAFSSYQLHRHAVLFPDPDRFDPDRWQHAQPDRTTYLPFSVGARKCIGDRFALTAITLALAVISSRWQLAPLTDKLTRPSVKATLTPRNLRLRATARYREDENGEVDRE